MNSNDLILESKASALGSHRTDLILESKASALGSHRTVPSQQLITKKTPKAKALDSKIYLKLKLWTPKYT